MKKLIDLGEAIIPLDDILYAEKTDNIDYGWGWSNRLPEYSIEITYDQDSYLSECGLVVTYQNPDYRDANYRLLVRALTTTTLEEPSGMVEVGPAVMEVGT